MSVADKIVVMNGGRVIAQGTHDKLLRSCEQYRRLWQASERSNAWTLAGRECR